MAFQIIYKFDTNAQKQLLVATTEEAFQKTTITEIKQKLSKTLPGKLDPGDLSLIFGTQGLDDSETIGFYKIQHMSLIFVILTTNGGTTMIKEMRPCPKIRFL